MSNVIPPITDPLGRSWRQPATDRILIDDKHAVMDRQAFSELAEYSTTIPSGVYSGKMWKRQHLHFGQGGLRIRPEVPEKWSLCWFGDSADPKLCSNNQRVILLT